MVDSGNEISYGYEDFHGVYSSMVDYALARPPEANIEAYWWRDGDKVQFDIRVENLSGETLSSSNSAAVHVIVYEDVHLKSTDRFGRTAVQQSISSLVPNASEAFQLETSDLVDVNWDKLHFVVLVDYKPSGTGSYDMLQAAIAQPVEDSFAVEPGAITFFVDPADLTIPSKPVNLTGPGSKDWSATTDAAWIMVIPSSGSNASQPVITVNKSQLSPGWQQGSVTFSAAAGGSSESIVVKTYLGAFERMYLPAVVR